MKVVDQLSVTWRDGTERIALQQALHQRVPTESLTTLLNHEELFSRMERLSAGEPEPVPGREVQISILVGWPRPVPENLCTG